MYRGPAGRGGAARGGAGQSTGCAALHLIVSVPRPPSPLPLRLEQRGGTVHQADAEHALVLNKDAGMKSCIVLDVVKLI